MTLANLYLTHIVNTVDLTNLTIIDDRSGIVIYAQF